MAPTNISFLIPSKEIDADIERREEYVKQLEQEAGESPFAARLRAQGLLK